MRQLFVVVCMPFGQCLEANSLKFLSSSCSKQNSLCFIIQPLMCSSNYALLVLHPFDPSAGLISLIVNCILCSVAV